MALEVDLLGEGGPAAKADTLFYRSREAYKSRQIDDLWRAKAATSPKSLGAVIVSDAVLDHVRRELRRQTGHNVEAKELRDLIRKKVLHPDAL